MTDKNKTIRSWKEQGEMQLTIFFAFDKNEHVISITSILYMRFSVHNLSVEAGAISLICPVGFQVSYHSNVAHIYIEKIINS